jgi:hypothetical protein
MRMRRMNCLSQPRGFSPRVFGTSIHVPAHDGPRAEAARLLMKTGAIILVL